MHTWYYLVHCVFSRFGLFSLLIPTCLLASSPQGTASREAASAMLSSAGPTPVFLMFTCYWALDRKTAPAMGLGRVFFVVVVVVVCYFIVFKCKCCYLFFLSCSNLIQLNWLSQCVWYLMDMIEIIFPKCYNWPSVYLQACGCFIFEATDVVFLDELFFL